MARTAPGILGQHFAHQSRRDRQLQWYGTLPSALLLGGLLGRWDDVSKICSWFDKRVKPQYQAGTVEDEYMLMFLCIASDLSPIPIPGADRMLAKVKACRSRRPKLLYNLWTAAQEPDQDSFDKALTASVKHFLKVDAEDVPSVRYWVALHASAIWLVAERNGLKFLPTLPRKSKPPSSADEPLDW